MSIQHSTQTNHTGWTQKSVRAYVLGFSLCLILTLLSFGAVQFNVINKAAMYALITLFAIGQLIVQSVCFLGLNSKSEGRWNLLPFIFTALIIFFFVGGSLWIMYNLNALMIDPYLAQ